jgi:class 3 adenylate cyclase
MLRADHADVVADMALAMIETIDRINCDLSTPLQIRIGIHSGDVVAGGACAALRREHLLNNLISTLRNSS